MPGNRSPRWLEMRSSSGMKRRRPLRVIRQLHEARQHRRHLEAGELLLAGLRVAHPDREVEREPGDVGERMRGVDRERHQHREDLLRRRSRRCGRGRPRRGRPRSRCGCRRRRARASPGRGRRARAAPAARAPRREMSASTSCGARPTLVGTASPVTMRRLRPATRTMKNSSRLLAKIARKLARSSSGQRRVLGEFEHALVEREPAQLAVEVAVGGQRAVVDELGSASSSSSSRPRVRRRARRVRSSLHHCRVHVTCV